MRRLSAVDAIAPAWEHTRGLLLAPRSLSLALKIGAVAVFAQMGGCNLNAGAPTNSMGGHSPHIEQPYLALIVAIAAVLLIVGLVLFYLGSRLQFVLFEIVATRQTRIAPMWRRYGPATWRWIGIKVLFFLASLVCCLPFLVPAIFYFKRVVANPDAEANVMPSVAAIFGFFLAVLLVLVVIGSCYALLADFGLPSMALEATSISETIRRVVSLVRSETGSVVLYLIMRFLLALSGAIMSYIALLLSAFLLAIPLGAMAFGEWALWHRTQGAANILMILGWVALGVIFVVAFLLLAITLLGAVLTFIQAYALYFLGGRYPLLGNLLEPGPAYPFTPPPVFPSAEERKDDDGGPPMPMNPAVA
jgi:hypothetical protein